MGVVLNIMPGRAATRPSTTENLSPMEKLGIDSR